MTKNDVIEKLQAGYELANRGTGWWLSTPKKPYTAQQSVQLPDDLLTEMEADGQVEIKMLTTSARAVLATND